VLQSVHIVDADRETTCFDRGHKNISDKVPGDGVHLYVACDEVARQLIELQQSGYRHYDYSFLSSHSSDGDRFNIII
jgi:hypothetical protein